MAEKPLLKTSIPILAMGNRTFGIYSETYTAKSGEVRTNQVLGEVVAVCDPERPLVVKGFTPKFQGSRIQGKAEEFSAFLKGLAKLA